MVETGEGSSEGVEGFQMKYLELNILYCGINHWPDCHSWSLYCVPDPMRGTGEKVMPLSLQCDGRDTNRKQFKNLP